MTTVEAPPVDPGAAGEAEGAFERLHRLAGGNPAVQLSITDARDIKAKLWDQAGEIARLRSKAQRLEADPKRIASEAEKDKLVAQLLGEEVRAQKAERKLKRLRATHRGMKRKLRGET